jgi:hypothetical protein
VKVVNEKIVFLASLRFGSWHAFGLYGQVSNGCVQFPQGKFEICDFGIKVLAYEVRTFPNKFILLPAAQGLMPFRDMMWYRKPVQCIAEAVKWMIAYLNINETES